MKNRKNRKAFTLIELLVVIAIIAVLSVVVILSLNPAELLRQSRDSNRVSDMATLKSAISLYLADVSTPTLGTYPTCYTSLYATPFEAIASSGVSGTAGVSTSSCAVWLPTTVATTAVITSVGSARGVSGSGWIPVNLTLISSGAPIGSWPVDPVNATGSASCAAKTNLSSCGLFYTYEASGTTFKTSAMMESQKYSDGGSNDVETTDGGNNGWYYEQGTNLAL